MKYIIIGLGNFGISLAEKLTQMGHEVIGVDNNMGKIEAIKYSITHAICLDSTDPHAVMSLPLKDTEVVIVAIGEDEGANIMTTALMKKMQVKRLISRSMSPLHETVLEAMGIDEIVRPEHETAERWVKKLTQDEVIDSFELGKDYSIVESIVGSKYHGKNLAELNLSKIYNILVLTTMRESSEINFLGISKKTRNVYGIATAQTIIHKGDILVLYGKNDDIQKFLDD
jgi:trk system potassium uptake protein TrkA